MTLFRPRQLLASAVAAVVVAAIAHLATILAFFIANQQRADVLTEVNNFFVPATLVAVVLVFVFSVVGALSRWYTALAAGLVSGAIAALAGTGIQNIVLGVSVDGDLIASVVSTLLSINLIFLLAITAATATIGRRVHGALARSEAPSRAVSHTFLVRRPVPTLAEGSSRRLTGDGSPGAELDGGTVDVEFADEQWESYVAAFVGAGWTPVEVEGEDELENSVFVEDSVVVFGRLAVLSNPAVPRRVEELAAVEQTVRGLGLDVTRIVRPGTLEGGDVLKLGKTIYVGRSDRTNAEGIRQLRHILSPLGYTVIAVPVSKAVHLKSAVTALPDGTVIGYPPSVDDVAMFGRFLAVPEQAGAHVVVLSGDTVLMSSAAPASAQLIESLGYRVIAVDIAEFEKLGACVTCLSVRIR